MPLILSLAMIVPGAVCVACAAAARPRASRTAVVGAAVMLAAMIAMAAGRMGNPIAWTAALIGVAMAGAVVRRIRSGRSLTGNHALDWHAPVGLVVSAALIAGAAGVAPAADAVHEHGVSGAVILAGAVAYVVAVVASMLLHRHRLTARHAAEGVSMVIMTTAMVVMPFV